MHVRGFTRHPSSGVGEKTRGTFAGLIEKIPYLQQLGITAVELLAGLPVRRAGLPAGQGQLLGLCAGLVLRAAPGVQLAPGSARPGGRVPRHGQGAAPGGHRGHPRRRVQPHRGGRPPRADALLPRTGQHRVLHPRGGPLALRQLHRHRQHAQRQPSDRPPDDRRQPPLLGRGDARGRLPLRSRVDPGARRVGSARCRTRRSCGTSSRIRRWPARSSSPRRGTRPASTRSAASSGTAGRSGTGGSATTSAASSAASRARWRGWRTGWWAAPRSTGTRNARPSRASTSSPATTASPSTTSSPTTTSTTRRNGEDNRDGAERQPQLELRRRGADRRPGRRAAAQPAGEELPDRHDALARRAHDPDGRRGAAHPARQQQRLLPGQRDQLVRLDAGRQARGRAPVRDACSTRGGSCGTWSTSASA